MNTVEVVDMDNTCTPNIYIYILYRIRLCMINSRLFVVE